MEFMGVHKKKGPVDVLNPKPFGNSKLQMWSSIRMRTHKPTIILTAYHMRAERGSLSSECQKEVLEKLLCLGVR